MVRLDKIYTRTGDGGETRLSTGQPVAKHDARVHAYGEVDELNAVLGLCVLAAPAGGLEEALGPALRRIQNDLFDLGADLATPDDGSEMAEKALRIAPAQPERLETEIDAFIDGLEPLTSFILPGGSELAARLHLARTVCRRAERAATALAADEEERVGAPALRYLNRLSDWLFVAARAANNNGRDDILWTPGANR